MELSTSLKIEISRNIYSTFTYKYIQHMNISIKIFTGAKFIVGKGLTLKDVTHIRKSYIQAIRALYVRNNSDEQIYSYADIGCYKVLFEVNSKSILEEYIKDYNTEESYIYDNI